MHIDRVTMDPAELDPLGAVHGYCAQSGSTHHVLDRTLMQAMPEGWQRRYVAVHREYVAAHAASHTVDYRVETGTWRYPEELDHVTRRALMITFNVQGWVCEQNHGHDQDCDPDECDPDQAAAWVYYDAHGEQIGGAAVFVPSPNPVPPAPRGLVAADLGEAWRGCHRAEQVRQLLAVHEVAAATHAHAEIPDTVVVFPVTRLDRDDAVRWSNLTVTALTTVPGWMIIPPPTPAERQAYGAALAVRLATTDGRSS